jgi:hypothetical protein
MKPCGRVPIVDGTGTKGFIGNLLPGHALCWTQYKTELFIGNGKREDFRQGRADGAMAGPTCQSARARSSASLPIRLLKVCFGLSPSFPFLCFAVKTSACPRSLQNQN